MKDKPDQTPLKSTSRRTPMSIRPIKCLLLGLVLALLLLDHGFGAEWPDPPRAQPAKMSSRVDYDPKLTDPFFESKKRNHSDYDFEGTASEKRQRKPQRAKLTAECFSTSFEGGDGKHLVNFCEAKLLGVNVINLFIHESNPADEDALSVQIRNGMFTSEYWTVFRIEPRMPPGATWTTKRQELTLDKKTYQKGDVIKGRIDFECVQQIIDPILGEHFGKDPTTIKVYGVFKTIVE